MFDITNQSLPEAAKASQINNILKEILYLTERLTNANNQAARRIAFEELKQQETKLSKITEDTTSSIHLRNQITTTRKEVEELNALIIAQINNRDVIHNQLEQAYRIQDKIIHQINTSTHERRLLDGITMDIINSVALGHKALNLHQLQPVRQLAKETKISLSNSIQLTRALSLTDDSSLIADIDKLNNILLSETGLFNLTIKQLQISGRTRGRGNFLHNLISDISKLSESNFHKINQSIINSSQDTSLKIAEHVKWSIILAISVLLLLVAAIYFINQKIVMRLLTLNKSVLKRINSQQADINVEGKDEISYLARSFVYFSDQIEAQKEQLQLLSLTDSLTNLPNRRAMDERLGLEVHTALRGKMPLSILMLDIDYFKPYNDFYGHVAGDECLKEVAVALKGLQQRESDFIARYGGEEFVMLLPTTDKEGAINVAEYLINKINNLKLPHEKSQVADHITVSVGVSTFTEAEIKVGTFSVDNILKISDRALYAAKESGRNRYCHADELAKE